MTYHLAGTYLFDPPEEHKKDCGFVLPKTINSAVAQQFLRNKTGWMYSLPFCEVMGFVNTKYADFSENWPDVQLFLGSGAENTDGGLFWKRIIGLNDEFYAMNYENILYKDAFTIIPLLLRPRSRGRLRLKSNLVTDAPLIYPNYFTDPIDLKVLVYTF